MGNRAVSGAKSVLYHIIFVLVGYYFPHSVHLLPAYQTEPQSEDEDEAFVEDEGGFGDIERVAVRRDDKFKDNDAIELQRKLAAAREVPRQKKILNRSGPAGQLAA